MLRILVPGVFTPEVGSVYFLHCADAHGQIAGGLAVYSQCFTVLVCWCATVQVGYLLLVALMLVLRTYADVWVIQNGTSIEG